MKVYIDKTDENREINFDGSVKDLLNKLDINIETVIVVRNNELLTQDDRVSNNHEIKILSVVSGG